MARRPIGKILSSIIQNIREGAIGIDRDGKVLIINPAGAAVLCSQVPEPLGMKIWDVTDVTQFVRSFVSLVKESDPQPLEQILPFPGNRIFLVKMNPVYGSDGRIVGAIAIMEDVTDMERVEQTVNEFVATVSHELKTPLTSIKGFVETLLEGALNNPEITRRFLQVINEETNRLTRLVINLLDLTKAIKSEGAGPDFSPINTSLFIQEAVKLFEPIAREKGLTLEYHVPSNLPSINANADRLRQVLINLVDNAIKYTGVKDIGGTVRVEAFSNDEGLVVKVIDTGVGIPADEQEKVFEKFYRVTEGPASQLGGTGLGLSITREIIENHGGTIQVFSNQEQGSTFEFNIPVARKGDKDE